MHQQNQIRGSYLFNIGLEADVGIVVLWRDVNRNVFTLEQNIRNHTASKVSVERKYKLI